ncbi:M20/M25/M40 family metallo-hydrolase [Liquorilactobacillus satsumensis]|uniref:M20/M25/M40 family metallo-hydrolase n=1 Tax=Liquorilactobacillus satsumensis TaxID=259059 RepID=UPI001E51545D|nr:M20/M25/M40 family metallo-hydrolase [Liquorilactobacillus satsumensis]
MIEKQKLKAFAERELDSFSDYLRIPSISAQNSGINETVAWLQETFSALGATVEVWHDQGGNPVVFAELKGNSSKTVLFYNHYDVQPPEPLDEWKTPPFEPTLVAGKLVARGVCDDKGELMSRLTLIKYFKENGGLPVNLKFIIEGEEELGSPHVDAYVHAHASQLAADVCIWEGGGRNESEQFQITCGLKGIASFDLEVVTAASDLHSSLASYADNAAWRLVQALSSLKDQQGRIKVAGFYDDVMPLTEDTKKAIKDIKFDAKRVTQEFGLLRPFVTDDPAKALVNSATLTINGLSSGYEGDGTKTVVPRRAVAKLDCRLVPNQEPAKIAELIQQQLIKNGFADVKLHYNTGESAFRTDLNDPFVKLNVAVAKEVYGASNYVVVPNMPGGGPAKQFVDELAVPIVMIGIHYAGSGPHAPNENIRLSDYQDATAYLGRLLEAYQAE